MNDNAAQQAPADEPVTAPVEDVKGPGNDLRLARERKGLDVASVANRLHLGRSIIEGLEADDFERLPEAIFVRGYLRNYARLVGLSPDEMIVRYEQAAGVPPLKTTDAQAEDMANGGGGTGTWLVLVVVVVLGAAALIWWQLGGGERILNGGAVAERGIPEPSSALPAEPVGTAAPMPGGPVEAEAPAFADVSAEEAVAAVEESPLAEASDAASAREVEPTAAEAAAIIGRGGEAAPEEALIHLHFRFSDRCWASATDGTGARIFFRNFEAGDERIVEVVPPVEIRLGNAAASSLEVDGEPFDLTPHSHANIADFTIGEAPAVGDAQ